MNRKDRPDPSGENQIIASERYKYRRMWERPEYRERSPGLNSAPHALEIFVPAFGATIRDYGCGEGLAVDWFSDNGMRSEGCDLVSLRRDIREVCLWNLPDDMQKTDYAYCCDVLEHLPQQYVGDAIVQIKHLTNVAGYFTIATQRCDYGDLIGGEELHLTVQPLEWWQMMFRRWWGGGLEYHATDKEWRHVIVASMRR